MGRAAKPTFSSFAEFWPYYVGEHRRPLCRRLHYAAALASLALVAGAALTRQWWLLLLVPVVGYGIAWIAHLAVERNRPATWSHVRWSLIAEYRMFLLGITGRMDREMVRLYGSPDPAPDAPCRSTSATTTGRT